MLQMLPLGLMEPRSVWSKTIYFSDHLLNINKITHWVIGWFLTELKYTFLLSAFSAELASPTVTVSDDLSISLSHVFVPFPLLISVLLIHLLCFFARLSACCGSSFLSHLLVILKWFCFHRFLLFIFPLLYSVLSPFICSISLFHPVII